jgi:electron-transferring-flavoprotein dehydrogenase
MEKLVLNEPLGDEATPLDVLFVGGGPAGLAGAIQLAKLIREDGSLGEIEIGVLEKAESLGEHNLSGAVVNPRSLQELFPDLGDEDLPLRTPVGEDHVYLLSESVARRVPAPREMHNAGHYVASICEIVRWLGERAEELGVNLFTGFPAESLLVEDRRVIGVRTAASGLDREGNPGSGYMPPNDLGAQVTVLTDGTRSALAQSWSSWQGVGSINPQI